MAKQRIVVGISGGVDSAVAAMLLLQQGYAVEGLFMKNWEEDDDAEYCAAEEDYKEARAVCAQLGIPLHAVNFAHEYWERVFSYFLDEYRAGRTPNPDVLCNKEIKFKAFLDHALRLGADGIATGHYARCTHEDGQYRLRKARDTNKDQSYFLYLLNQDALRYAHFPIGELEKPQVRALAQEAGLPNYARKDSTGICFIGERKFKTFLSRYLPAQPGEIRTLEDKVIGRHDGLMYYTIGQRQGLGIGGVKDSDAGQPWYVVDKNLTRNVLHVAQGEEHPALYKTRLRAGQLHWIGGNAPLLPFICQAKTRYRQADQVCVVDNIVEGVASMQFEQPQRAVTPGQSLVFYRDDECVGGSVITDTV